MKYLTLVLSVFLLIGCTSIKPVELPPEKLQERILNGSLISVGDKIQVVTSDGVRSTFEVVSIDGESISSKDQKIHIKDIIALETKSFSGGKTSALVGGTLLWLYVILLSIPAIVVL
jgi:hypothetical protein